MRICFFSPYLPNHFGGGEKHLLDVALAAAKDHQVLIGVPRERLAGGKTLQQVKKDYQKFVGSDLDAISFVETPLGTKESALSKMLWTSHYDAIYYVTDGSLFFTLADHNFLHIQIPFTHKINNPINRIKLGMWEHKNTNSQFTKKIIEQSWNTKVNMVLNPLVNVTEFKFSHAKEKRIISVGRFFKQLHSKRQDILIRMFKQLCEYQSVKKNWQLILVGSVEDEAWVAQLKKDARGYPVRFKFDLPREELIQEYQTASIFWHAAGFGVDERVAPESVEHFGISTVEAMAAGCVPLTYLAGGQNEVLGEENLHLGWKTEEECLDKTWRLIKNKKLWQQDSTAVKKRALQFDKARFDKKVHSLFQVNDI